MQRKGDALINPILTQSVLHSEFFSNDLLKKLFHVNSSKFTTKLFDIIFEAGYGAIIISGIDRVINVIIIIKY